MAYRLESKRDHSPFGDRPNMSELRIVLMGNNVSENTRVGNFILNKKVFGKKTPSPDIERFSGTVKGRNITVINTVNLLKSKVSLQKMEQKVSELSRPEPHVIILVLQHKDFSAKNRDILTSVLNCFGEQMMKRTMVLTTDDNTHSARQKSENEIIQQISTECGGGRLQLQNTQCSQILQKVDEIITTQQEVNLPTVFSKSEKQKLSFAICGCNEGLKASMSKILLGGKMPISAQSRSVHVWRDVELHGRLISLVELPVLNQLSEEEVMRQTLRCVSVCDPGVHVFILIVPAGPLTDEDKAEIEKIKGIFDTREHFMVLFTSNLPGETSVTDLVQSSTESQRLISLCGGRYRVMGLQESEQSRQIPELLHYVENMNTEPYSLQMYVKAQANRARNELEKKYKEELSEMESKIKELQQKLRSEGAEEEEEDQVKSLRIVLIGRTGSGKSATGNTILGRNEFQSESSTNSVTNVCEKRFGETDGKSVAVVDTPGLFDTTLSNDQVIEEIVKCVAMASPGPHVFVIVLSVARFTKEEADAMQLIKRIFGHEAARFSVVLFTGGDNLENKSIEKYVSESKSAELKNLIVDCRNRYLVFNNKEKRDRTQVSQLLNMIEEVKKTNEGRYFTNSMFEEAEMFIKNRMVEIMNEKDREIQAQREKIMTEKETVMKILEEKKQQTADEERVKMENQFREKEEKLRKEIEEKEKTEQKKREIENQKRSEEEKQQRAEYHRKIEELKREIENQKSQYEKQQKEREEEDRKREEKYRQDQEKMKNEQERIIAELRMKQDEETKRRQSEEKRRNKEEEKERQEWGRKIKEAENDRKEIQEEIKRQQREWEDEKKQQMREREEGEKKRKERHKKHLREKQEELEKMRKKFEREREEERQNIEDERLKQRRKREEKEREYAEKKREMNQYYEQLERERKEDWERRKQDDDERREEERKRWKKRIEDLKQERDSEIEKREKDEERIDREEMERDDMKKKYEMKIKVLRKQYEEAARKQAEEFFESREKKLQHILELDEMLKERQKQHELLVKLYKHLHVQKGEEIKELQQEVEELKNKTSGCVIM